MLTSIFQKLYLLFQLLVDYLQLRYFSQRQENSGTEYIKPTKVPLSITGINKKTAQQLIDSTPEERFKTYCTIIGEGIQNISPDILDSILLNTLADKEIEDRVTRFCLLCTSCISSIQYFHKKSVFIKYNKGGLYTIAPPTNPHASIILLDIEEKLNSGHPLTQMEKVIMLHCVELVWFIFSEIKYNGGKLCFLSVDDGTFNDSDYQETT